MSTPKPILDFPKYHVSHLIDTLERMGKYTVDSKFLGTSYMIDKNNILVLGGEAGILAIRLENVDKFIEELQGIKELAIDRKTMRLKGA